MAGIQHLYDIYKKDPKFVEKLLDSNVEVEEKLDGSRFGFEVKEGDVMKFFKRNDSAPITKIDRTLAKYYEKAIFHFESFTNEKLSQFPDGWRFGFEYFPNLVPVKIAYDRIPLNNLVLTDITIRDPQGKVQDIITDKKTLDKWSNTLECEGPPVIFAGKLSSDQRTKILDFLTTSEADLKKKFSTENFAKFFMTLNPSLGKSFMQNSLDKDIEALVFKFDGKNPLKVMNPSYSLSKVEKKQSEKPSDIYSLTLVFLQEFFQELDFKKVKLKGKSFEERYIEFISKVFNLFCKSKYYTNNFEGEVDFDLPDFLTREEAAINYKFVTNPETLELLKRNSTNRELFKIMMASMRAHKKKPFGFFKKELIWFHNEMVDKIADYINDNIKEAFLSYDEFREVFMMNESEEEWEEFGMNKINETGFPTYVDIRKPKRESPGYLETLKKFTGKEAEASDLTSSSLVICNTTPFHSGILTALRDANEISGKKTILCMIGYPFKDMSSYQEMAKQFISDNKGLLHTALILKIPRFDSLTAEAAKSKLKIDHVYCPKNLAADYKLQSGNHDAVFTDSNDNLKDVGAMDALRSGDLDRFKKVCLPVAHKFFYKLKGDLIEE